MLVSFVPEHIGRFDHPPWLLASGEIDKTRAFGAEHVQAYTQRLRLSLAVHCSTKLSAMLRMFPVSTCWTEVSD